MSGIAAILAFFGWFWSMVKYAFTWILDGCKLLFQWIFFTIFDGLCMVVEAFFRALDFSAIAFNYAGAWAGLPDQVVWIITQIGLPQGVALLGGAYMVRLGLNLIPSVFTRV